MVLRSTVGFPADLSWMPPSSKTSAGLTLSLPTCKSVCNQLINPQLINPGFPPTRCQIVVSATMVATLRISWFLEFILIVFPCFPYLN